MWAEAHAVPWPVKMIKMTTRYDSKFPRIFLLVPLLAVLTCAAVWAYNHACFSCLFAEDDSIRLPNVPQSNFDAPNPATVLRVLTTSRRRIHCSRMKAKKKRVFTLLSATVTLHLWLGLFLLASGIEPNPGPRRAHVRPCCIPNCSPASRSTSSFVVRSQWEDTLRQRFPSIALTKSSRVCLRHFRKSDYDESNGRYLVRCQALPSVFDFETESIAVASALPDHQSIGMETDHACELQHQPPSVSRAITVVSAGEWISRSALKDIYHLNVVFFYVNKHSTFLHRLRM